MSSDDTVPDQEWRPRAERATRYVKGIAGKAETRGIESLSQQERDVYLVDLLDLEVGNGGFSQFFFNSSGQNWSETRDAIERQGLRELGSIYTNALTVFPDSILPSESTARRELLAELTDAQEEFLTALDQQYYDLGSYVLKWEMKLAEQAGAP